MPSQPQGRRGNQNALLEGGGLQVLLNLLERQVNRRSWDPTCSAPVQELGHRAKTSYPQSCNSDEGI